MSHLRSSDSFPFVFALLPALAASLLFCPATARAEAVVGVSGETAFPSSATSGVDRNDSVRIGGGFGVQAGYQFDLGPVAVRPEAIIDYTRMPTSVLRLMAGGRMQGTGLVAPFAIARAGWGRGTYETTSLGLALNPDGRVDSMSGSGFAYELGAGLGFKPSSLLELELLVAYNAASEPVAEDVPLFKAQWLSAGLGATYHF
jgi:opacity protein-like surface antigen